MTTEAQKRQNVLWEHKWLKNEHPYFKCCVACQLSCSMKVKHAETSYDIFSCPKKDRGEPIFPYKWKEMLKQRETEQKERGINAQVYKLRPRDDLAKENNG